MSRRIRTPETVKIAISRGDWIVVKKHLTAGEQRKVYAGMVGPDRQINPTAAGLYRIAGYLLDWSFTDAADRPVVIRDQPESVLLAALDAIDVDAYTELLETINAHDTAMAREREAEKKSPDGASGSFPISPSVD